MADWSWGTSLSSNIDAVDIGGRDDLVRSLSIFIGATLNLRMRGKEGGVTVLLKNPVLESTRGVPFNLGHEQRAIIVPDRTRLSHCWLVPGPLGCLTLQIQSSVLRDWTREL